VSAMGSVTTRLASGRLWRIAVGFVVFFVAWELYGRTGRALAVPPFTEVSSELRVVLASGELVGPTLGTAAVALLGFLIAGVLGSVLGLLIGLSSTFRQVVGPWVNAAYATPMTMFIPIIGMYFGLGMGSQVFLVVTFCIFGVLMNTAEGVQAVPTQYFELARTIGISKPAAVLRIVIPFALPYAFVGLRISVASAFAGAITAELLLATDDLGLMMMTASGNFQFVKLAALTFYVALLGFVAVGLVYALERWVAGRLRPSN
jgi:ABC-type nitrate/sulfonate/bicarbonate transport system permease component